MKRSHPNPVHVRWPTASLALIAATFFLLAVVRLGLPSFLLYDEGYYVSAARKLALREELWNREHPMLGKELIAATILFFGDNPFGWRIGAVLSGAVGIYFLGKAVFTLTCSRRTAVMATLLLASNFLIFVVCRLALLDGFMFLFACVAVSAYAHTLTLEKPTVGDFAVPGLLLGLAMACKWSVAPLVMLCGLHIFLASRESLPVRILQASVFSFSFVAAYSATFIPGFFVRQDPLRLADLLPLQVAMKHSVGSFIRGHPGASYWWEWVSNSGPMWLNWDTNIVLLTGNPISMTLLVPVLASGAFLKELRSDRTYLSCVLAFVFLLAFWAINGKPVQFYYHYLLPSAFGMCGMAVILEAWWERGQKWPGLAMVGGSLVAFAVFFPVLSAGDVAPRRYAVLPGWDLNPKPLPPLDPAFRRKAEAARRCMIDPTKIACPK